MTYLLNKITNLQNQVSTSASNFTPSASYGSTSTLTYQGGTYTLYNFTSVGTFTFNAQSSGNDIVNHILVVGGGGGAGGYFTGGGGGAGGVIAAAWRFKAGETYTIIVGAGGSAGSGYQNGYPGTMGGTSSFVNNDGSRRGLYAYGGSGGCAAQGAATGAPTLYGSGGGTYWGIQANLLVGRWQAKETTGEAEFTVEVPPEVEEGPWLLEEAVLVVLPEREGTAVLA